MVNLIFRDLKSSLWIDMLYFVEYPIEKNTHFPLLDEIFCEFMVGLIGLQQRLRVLLLIFFLDNL